MLSEEVIIQSLHKLFPIKTNSARNRSSKHLLGIGDDCAIIPKNNKSSYLISTDALVENTHFILNKITAKELAYKAIAVNISDIAAMGGKPLYIFISMALTNSLKDHWVKLFINNINKAAKKFNIILLGGDTVSSNNNIFINITVLGEIENKYIKYRSQAKDQDIIAVTGNLGNSKLGLDFLLGHIKNNKNSKYFIKKHYEPYIYHNEGLFLSSKNYITSMMDVSDGLSSDLNKLCKSSNVGAQIDINNIPVSKKLVNYFNNKLKAKTYAASGGEDYVLLFTIKEKYYNKFKAEYYNKFKKNIYNIGVMNKKNKNNKKVIFKDFKDNKLVEIPESFEHFTNDR